MMTNNNIHSASFRDPSGFLFWFDGVLYRQVNTSYQTHYDALMQSGLYTELVKKGYLVKHQEVEQKPAFPEIAYKVIAPEKIPFVSYPYEWSFSELKDAALLTLDVCILALGKDLVLKDASAYNIQFVNGRPVLIDTLSFEKYQEGAPWVAYRQFCQHFLAPLALMAYTDIRLSQLMRVYIDGIPLDLASKLLPGNTQWKLGIATHIHIHAKTQQKFAGKAISQEEKQHAVRKTAMLGLLDSLKGTVNSLKWEPSGTEWADYYDITNYSGEAFEEKKSVIQKLIDMTSPASVWDLGANNGIFSRLASEKGIPTVAADIDPSAVELGYLQVKKEKTKNLLPLVLDLTNPSPGAGWNNEERQSFTQRGPVDLVMALALIHHLAISNNVPLERVAKCFAQMGKWLIIEFVPKSDSQVQRLLSSRLDIFDGYSEVGFEESFSKYYTIEQKVPVKDSQRILYLMRVIE